MRYIDIGNVQAIKTHSVSIKTCRLGGITPVKNCIEVQTPQNRYLPTLHSAQDEVTHLQGYP